MIRVANPPAPPKIQPPASQSDWTKLLRLVIERTEILQHRHLPGLRSALILGSAEKHLRMLGILSPMDIDREYPLPK